MKKLGIGSLTSCGQLLAQFGRRFKTFITNEQPDEAWAKFALAEAREELRAAGDRKRRQATLAGTICD
jgi:hypothetical protein